MKLSGCCIITNLLSSWIVEKGSIVCAIHSVDSVGERVAPIEWTVEMWRLGNDIGGSVFVVNCVARCELDKHDTCWICDNYGSETVRPRDVARPPIAVYLVLYSVNETQPCHIIKFMYFRIQNLVSCIPFLA
jgi:hypothetical protein